MPFVRVASATDVGHVRSLNEDALLAGTHLWAVADGMGGHAAGDVASRLAIETLATIDRPDLTLADVEAALLTANARMIEHGTRHPEAAGLGTTLTALVEVAIGGAHHWAVVNVGDSRVYRLERGRLARATIDHSEVEELVMAGFITEEEARVRPDRNVITRSLGPCPRPRSTRGCCRKPPASGSYCAPTASTVSSPTPRFRLPWPWTMSTKPSPGSWHACWTPGRATI